MIRIYTANNNLKTVMNRVVRLCLVILTASLKVLRLLGILSGEATLQFSFCLPARWGLTLKDKNLLPFFRSKFFLLRTSFIPEGLRRQKVDQEVTKVVPVAKIAGKAG